ERGGRFLAAEVEEVAARDDELVLLAQRIDQVEQAATVLGRDGRRLGGWGRIPRAKAFDQPQLELLAASRRSDPVARLIGHDAKKPWTQLGAGAKAVDRAECLDEALLGG